jgi:hypothetical protein
MSDKQTGEGQPMSAKSEAIRNGISPERAGKENGMNTTAKTALDANIDNLEARLVADGRDGLFDVMSSGHFSFPLGRRSVSLRISNAGDVRRICRELNDREVAEYIVFIILLVSMSLTERHGSGFFLSPGRSHYSIFFDAKPFAVAREMLEEIRCDQIAALEGVEPC